MDDTRNYENFLRMRITELRLKKDVSEHKMSLELGKSGSYIRSISSGIALPSVRELFNIMDYFGITPPEFFAPLAQDNSLCTQLCQQLHDMTPDDLQKVETFIGWISK